MQCCEDCLAMVAIWELPQMCLKASFISFQWIPHSHVSFYTVFQYINCLQFIQKKKERVLAFSRLCLSTGRPPYVFHKFLCLHHPGSGGKAMMSLQVKSKSLLLYNFSLFKKITYYSVLFLPSYVYEGPYSKFPSASV